jgi:hypothetical protein
MAKYNKVRNIVREFGNLMLALVDTDEQDLLKIDGDDRRLTAYSLRELMSRFKEVFGEFGEAELDSIRASLGDPMVDVMQLVKHLMSFERKLKMLTDNKRLVDEADKKTWVIKSVGGYGGQYRVALTAYTVTPLAEQTYLKLKAALISEHLRLIRINAITAQNAGFAAPISAQAVANAAAIVAAGGGRGGGGGPQQHGGAGRGGGAQGRGGRGRGGRNIFNAAGVIVGIQNDTHYCWSHGPNGGAPAHHSPACPDPEPGHVNTATFANIQGGRVIFCHSSQRQFHPHP